jgi:hypothetical protein
MTCNLCGSVSLHTFESETSIHFPRLKDADKLLVVVVCDQLLVCLNCGKAEFVVPENKLAACEGRCRSWGLSRPAFSVRR